MPSSAPPIKRAREVFHSIKSHANPANRRSRNSSIKALVLAAFDDVPEFRGELKPWRDTYDFTKTVHVDGVPAPVRVTEEGLGIVLTGIGKPAAATTMAALAASDRLNLDETLFLTVGVAGGPPDIDVGSVVIADTIVDWDHKFRVDPSEDDDTIALNPYTGGSVYTLNPDLVEWAVEIARAVDLPTEQETRPGSSLDPVVVTGTNVCGDELWHGRDLSRQVDWLVNQHGIGPYRATEMEDTGTSCALERFGYLDQYLCIRGISNHDRPAAETCGIESLQSSDFVAGFDPAIHNAVAVGREVVDRWLR